MELTSVQRRTLAGLIEVGEGVTFPAGLDRQLRERISAGIRGCRVPAPVRLWKERLNDLDRCEGLFEAGLRGERRPFEHSPASAAGSLLHKAIEMDIWSPEEVDIHGLTERAVACMRSERGFAEYWDSIDPIVQGELTMRAVKNIEHFRASFPPLRRMRRELAPVSEHWLEATVAGGEVTVVGKVDLLLNVAHHSRSTRVLIDLKGGRAWSEHPEDMRLYALLYTLRYGVPPCRVATFHLSSGEWQPEEVSEPMLERAADRVALAIRATSELRESRRPELTPGPHCVRCPRLQVCPVAERPRVPAPI